MNKIFATAATAVLLMVLTLPPSFADTLVVANKSDDTATLIDLATGEVAATVPTGKNPHEVAISPDGALAVITDYGNRDAPGHTLTLIDIAAARVLRTIDLGDYTRPHGILFTAERRVLVTAEGKQALIEVDIERGTVLQAVSTDQDISHMVAFENSTQRAFVANIGSGSITVVDLAKGEKVADIATGEGAEGVTVAGSQVWVSNRAADTLTVLDAASLKKVQQIDSKGFPIRAVALPNNESVLVTHARAGNLAVYSTSQLGNSQRVDLDVKAKDVDDRLFRDRFGDSSVPIGVLPDRQGKRVWIAHANADVISEHDTSTWKLQRMLKAGREPDGMGYSPIAAGKN